MRATLSPALIAALAALTAALAAAPARVRAQEAASPDSPPAPAAGSVVGSVVDAESGLPLPGTRVVLSPLPLGVTPTASSSFVTSDRAVTTDTLGGYRFVGVASGDYVLHVQRMGYQPGTVQVSLRANGSSLVSLGMTVVPVRLQAVQVRALADDARARGMAGSADRGDRASIERLRQQRYLSADVRTYAPGDAQESIALAETDLFRALQRLPGVEARDNYSAELLTRGASGDGTRIYFDGLPLLDPLHGQGSLSGVASEAIGTAFLHPGVRPASLGEGGAAVVDLRTRSGATDTLHGVVHLTQFTARGALDRRAGSGRWAFMVAGQRTYGEESAPGFRFAGIAPPFEGFANGPLHYSDVAARADLRLGARSALEASGILAHDTRANHYSSIYYATFDSAAASEPHLDNRVASGNRAARLTLLTPIGALAGRIGIGASRYDASVDVAPGSTLIYPVGTTTERPMQTSVTHAHLFASLEPERPASDGAPPAWSLGAELMAREARFRGAAQQLFGRELVAGDTALDGALTTLALWGERRWRPSSTTDVEAGLRIEGSAAVRDAAGPLHAAPRITARHRLSPTTTVSAGVGRAYQYTQGLASPALGMSAVQYPSRLWMVSGSDVPALRTDVVTLGGERWLGARWLASANGFARRGEGLVLSDPRPGYLVDRPLFVTGGERAGGFELAARRLEGRWTASLAYTYTHAELLAEGLRFTSPYERRHAVDATAMFRVRPSLRLGAALSVSSGAPYTRTFVGGVRRSSVTDSVVYEYVEPSLAEAPFAHRFGHGTTADLLVDWGRAFHSWQLGAFLQLHGSIRPSASVLYKGTIGFGRPDSYTTTSCTGGAGCVLTNMGDTPYPLTPVFGFRVSF